MAARHPDLSRLFAEYGRPATPPTNEEPSLPEGFFVLGRLGRPVGLDGSVRVLIDADDPSRYRRLIAAHLWQQGRLSERRLLAWQQQGAEALARFEGIATPEQADALYRAELLLPLALLPALGPNQFYYHELSGARAHDATAGEIGTVLRVDAMPGQDVIVIAHPSGAEVLVPVVDAFVEGLDRAAGVLSLRLPEGLLEVYLQPAGTPDDAEA